MITSEKYIKSIVENNINQLVDGNYTYIDDNVRVKEADDYWSLQIKSVFWLTKEVVSKSVSNGKSKASIIAFLLMLHETKI